MSAASRATNYKSFQGQVFPHELVLTVKIDSKISNKLMQKSPK